ncbi:hypothetical protein J2S16_000215 [Cytobacillus kochii]|nr:hypothetical protein [Cytobacillus kochii]
MYGVIKLKYEDVFKKGRDVQWTEFLGINILWHKAIY